jgi:hypothetical protein
MKLREAIARAQDGAPGTIEDRELALWLQELAERRRSMSWEQRTTDRAIPCVTILPLHTLTGDSPRGTLRRWRRFVTVPRVGDPLRNLGVVTQVYWMLNLEAEGDAPPDVAETYYPILYLDGSSP